MLHIQRPSLNGLLASRQNNTTSLGRCGSASIPTLFRPRAACDYLQLLARSARVRYNTTLAEINVLTLRVAWRRPSPRRSTCMRSTAGKADVMTQSNSTSSRSLSYTAYEGNSWEVTFARSGLSGSAASVPVPCFRISAMQILHTSTCAGVTVLVDPWLEGDLVFANQTWLYRGQKGALKDVKLDLDVIGAHADVILLSQVSNLALRSSATDCATAIVLVAQTNASVSVQMHSTTIVLYVNSISQTRWAKTCPCIHSCLHSFMHEVSRAAQN